MNPYDAIAQFYDLEHEGLTSDTTMYLRLAREHGPDVLVLGAGTGRVVAPLAEAGFRVYGVDNSKAMLARAREKLRGRPGVRLIGGDLVSLALHRQFNLVVVPFDTFTMLSSQDEQIRALAGGRAHMADSSLLVVDVINPLILPTPEQNGLRRPRFQAAMGESLVSAFDAVQVDLAAQTMLMTIWYEQAVESNRRVTEVELPMRWVYRHELEALMRLAGLRVCDVYGDYDLSPYEDGSPRLIATGGL